MIWTWTSRDPDLAYRDTWLWLPRSEVSVETIRASLTIGVGGKRVRMWRMGPHHIAIPRARYGPGELPYTIVDRVPTSYEKIHFESNVVLDAVNTSKTVQHDAFPYLLKADGGVLNLACGIGKTVLFLHAVAQWGEPVLIINDQMQILNQWMGEINKFLRFDGGIGMIRGHPSTWTWRRPVVLASLKTLALYRDHIPAEMSRYYGRILWDECHHLAAHDFSQTADIFLGHRYGTTATVHRLDAAECIYLWHLGPVFYSNLQQDVVPVSVFIADPYTIDFDHDDCADVFDKNGEVHLNRLDAYLGKQPAEIKFCQSVIDEGIKRGKTMLVVSISKSRSRIMHQLYPGSGIMDSDVPTKDRLSQLRDHKLTFGTLRMATEALNKVSLDTLIILSEFSSPNILQQAMGRIQRECSGKVARLIVIHHVNIAPLRAMGHKLIKILRRWGIKAEVRT